MECAGKGRSFFTPSRVRRLRHRWRIGAVGVARWRGYGVHGAPAGRPPRSAVDVLPIGLDPNLVRGGVDLGPVRRPLPVRKSIEDVLLAYE